MSLTRDPHARRWSARDRRSGRFVSRDAVAAELARTASAQVQEARRVGRWPTRLASADVADTMADARGFFDVVLAPTPRPDRAARRRARETARAFGLTR